MGGISVKLSDLSFGYSKNSRILEDINLDISGGQMISIIGPNGVGKSTLIHCMNKILKPTSGHVFVDGKDLDEISIKELATKMGYVPHATSDSFPMTVMDTVLIGKRPSNGRKISNEDVREAYDTLKLLDIQNLAMRQFNQLSAGQHQKVALARGLVQNPRLLLLDEPTSNLDIKHQMDVSRLLKEWTVANSTTVIMICHDLNIAAKYSDYILMLHDKGIFALGTPGETITVDNVRTVYGVDCRIVDDGGRPHVILQDGLFNPSGPSGDSFCRS